MDWSAVENFLAELVPFETTGRLLLAALAGAVLGWERELQEKPAGLRTHMMVSLGAAAFLVSTLEFLDRYEDQDVVKHFDPLRVIAAVIGGIGFLGAGAILQSRHRIRGMTTAASIWVAAAIGIACGLGLIRIAFTTVVIALIILVGIGVLERRWMKESPAPEDEEP